MPTIRFSRVTPLPDESTTALESPVLTRLPEAGDIQNLELRGGRLLINGLEFVPDLFRLPSAGPLSGGSEANPSLRVHRVEDMLDLHVMAFGLTLTWPEGGGEATLALSDEEQDGHLFVVGPPQHIAEHTVDRSEGLQSFALPLLRRAARGYTLAFRWPAGQEGISLTAEALLERLAVLPLVVEAPGQALSWSLTTAIELPWRLVMTPDNGDVARVRGPARSVAKQGWHELHRFTVGGLTSVADVIGWRAIRALEPDAIDPVDPQASLVDGSYSMRASLTPRQRDELVALTNNPASSPELEAVRRFVLGRVKLSALGADAWLRGEWGEVAGVDLRAWIHETRLGRDTFVKVVEGGYLYPYGFKVSLVTICEREFHERGSSPVALLARHQVLLVVQPTVTRDGADTPFVRYELGLTSAELRDSQALAIPGAFWPRSRGSDVRFPVLATDRAGVRHRLTTTMIFVPGTQADQGQALAEIWEQQTSRHRLQLDGAVVAYVSKGNLSDSLAEPDTVLPTRGLVLRASASSSGGLPFAAALAHATVSLPASAATRSPKGGSAFGAGDPSAVTLSYAEAWTGDDPEFKIGRVWAQFRDPVDAGPGPEVSGGLVKLALRAEGLAVGKGPIASVNEYAQGHYYSSTVSSELGALLGGLPLAELLAVKETDPKTAPTLIFDPKTATPRLRWAPSLKQDAVALDGGLLVYAPKDGETAALTIEVALDDETGLRTLETCVTGICLTIAGALAITFDELAYEQTGDARPDVRVKLGGVRFLGPLAFVTPLANELTLGTSVDVLSDRILLTSGFSLPELPMGAFQLANLEFAVSVTLPLDGEGPRLGFAVNRREAPFLVAVCGLGGGGWLAMSLSTKHGLDTFEVGLFAAAVVSLNLGVASGGVCMRVGLSFGHDGEANTSTVTGFIEITGVVSVLGLVSVSVCFYLGLHYDHPEGGKAQLRGVANLRVKVSVLFFSKTVTLTVERTLAGADPPFSKQVSLADWQARFAAYA